MDNQYRLLATTPLQILYQQGISEGSVPADCPKIKDNLDRTQCKESKIYLHSPFKAIPSMRSP